MVAEIRYFRPDLIDVRNLRFHWLRFLC
jgi:hypothetical protein